MVPLALLGLQVLLDCLDLPDRVLALYLVMWVIQTVATDQEIKPIMDRERCMVPQDRQDPRV